MMMMDDAGQEYECHTPDEYKGSPAFAPPMAEVDGVTIAQTPAIMMAVGEFCKKTPEDAKKKAKACQVALDAADFLSDALNFAEKPERAEKWFAHVEGLCSSGCLDGDKPLFHDWSMMMVFNAIGDAMADQIKGKTKEWYEKMKETKGFKAWKERGVPQVPPSE